MHVQPDSAARPTAVRHAAAPTEAGKDWNAASTAITRAYDALAPGYDQSVSASHWVRERLWQRLAVLFPPGARVVDVTAGTGLDADYLAARGVQVMACDRSPGMLAQLRARRAGVPACAMDFNALALAPERAALDGIISTFAGLNTAADLSAFARAAAGLLRPGGVLFIHVLNRWPLLELARQGLRRRGRQFWQTLTASQRAVRLDEFEVVHYRFTPNSLYRRWFASDFRLGRVEAQGLWRPVDAGWGARLEPVERLAATRWPFYAWGTFFSLELYRR